MTDKDGIIRLPADALPSIEELKGDLLMTAKAIGVENALVLGQVAQDAPIRLYGVKTFLRQHRDRRIRQEYDKGASAVQLSRRYRLSERQIWNILGSPEPDERQMSMF